MGASFWSDDFYRDRETTRKAKGETAFAYHAATAAKPVNERKVHDKMNPKLKPLRESRDSKEHPNSLAIGVIFDVTGSMQRSPEAFQAKLGNLMNALTTTGYVADPQILVGVQGDANDHGGNFQGSNQFGEFESGIEIDEDLGRCWLVGGGGGSNEESYQNAAYFFARHTVTDCFEKRGKKGIFFMLGDENPYPVVSRREVEALFGDTLQEDIKTEDIFKELLTKWDVFFIIPRETQNGSNPHIRRSWVKLLGETNVFSLGTSDDVSDLVALITGIHEGKVTNLDQVRHDLRTPDRSASRVNELLSSVRLYAESKGLVDRSTTTRL